MNTGFNNKSELPPVAYSVEDPSYDHTGQSSSLPEKFFLTKVFPLTS
jgi:hypothetical protein